MDTMIYGPITPYIGISGYMAIWIHPAIIPYPLITGSYGYMIPWNTPH